MTGNALHNIAQIESSLWEAADQLRANSKLTSSEYCMPLLGVVFLRHATNRYYGALKQIEADQAAGLMPKRPLKSADFKVRRALMLPEQARYDEILKKTPDTSYGTRLVEAMNAIEDSFAPLQGKLPKEYEAFDRTDPYLLENLLRIFDSELLRTASGDVFGRIYEYFLMKFAIQGAQDNGEFFTPPSLVQTLVNVIEPDHGIVFDPACGSGGMFVQTSHFLEHAGKDTMKEVTFYGQEKTGTTIRLAMMNLAVHGLQGKILEANTFYQDEHSLFSECDFVMANPPFNVDMVDAERIRGDRRLPFGLPGTTKGKSAGKNKEGDTKKNKETVSNGNYLWISYFHSYLKPTGRAGFVMSSQASSAGHAEAEVRRKLVETGDVDAMIAIRSNFFYTRTVPCELWFFDKGKTKERQDTVLMLDARNVYRKVTRKIYDFSPEQLKNLTSIVWLYRGQSARFLDLVKEYLRQVCAEAAAIPAELASFEASLGELRGQLSAFADSVKDLEALKSEQLGESGEPILTTVRPELVEGRASTSSARTELEAVLQDRLPLFTEALAELDEAETAYQTDREILVEALANFRRLYEASPPCMNLDQQAAREAFAPLAEQTKGLAKQVDLLYKLTAGSAQLAQQLATVEAAMDFHDRKLAGKRLKQLEEERKQAEEQLKLAAYFHRQVVWLQDRFPDAQMRPVPGLCKVVTRADIEAADWSLTPGRYVGVAPPEVDEDFDFEQTMRDIHVELADLNREAVELAMRIQENFEGLGI
jgi:type I restriction enzyme M protein